MNRFSPLERARCVALAALASIALAAAACGSATTPQANAPSNAAMAPDFSVDLMSGENFRLADHLGKDVVLIDFWTTFCVPCVAVLTHLEEIQNKYKDKGLVVLGVAMDPPETAGQIGPFMRSHGLHFAVAHDINSQVTNLYNKKTAAPYQVLIGRNGQIIKRRETYQPGDEVGMEADVVAALAQAAR
ncbi:MAG: TlpA family protein disulfide reductase [Deltaproteobacteria bacterium]|nr:TlpA family protein disulfide reductase [Deltaproteobacteria bacterium]